MKKSSIITLAIISLLVPLTHAAAPADEARFPGVRTVPDPACASEYWFDPVPFANMFARAAGGDGIHPPQEVRDAIAGTGPDRTGPMTGDTAPPAIAATLPDMVHLRGRVETYNHERYFALRDGTIYTKPNVEVTGADGPWVELLVPDCLKGEVTQISADDTVLLALNDARQIYTLDYADGTGPGAWTRRWGPFFWTDMGARLPGDVRDWDTSILHAGRDKYFLDGAGRPQKPWGILTVYALRGDGRRITYLDPWLPSDESREVCGPERGTAVMAGLAGSGSTVMVITTTGDVYSRVYEFDISGANTVLLQYSWQDQDGVSEPRIQLPAPDWVHHGRVPGPVTDRISFRKVSPGTEHRIMRVEGTNANGATGYWQKDTAGGNWQFVATGQALTGRALPLPGPTTAQSEDATFEGLAGGHPARLNGFNPYCSPARLRIELPGGPLDLIVHSVDGLRQERRARGLDASPRYYRGAIEVPRVTWDARASLPGATRDFLDRHFGETRIVEGPLYATAGSVHLWETCWTFARVPADPVALITQPWAADAGSSFADVQAQGMENRGPLPARC